MEANTSGSSLNSVELKAVLNWVDSYELSRCKKKLNRDFSDGVLLAEILKFEFPFMVDLHNYNGCSAVQCKMQNWEMLNRKVLRKLQIVLKPEEIEKVANAETSCVEGLLARVMKKIQVIKKGDGDKAEPDIPEASSIMTIKVWKQVGDIQEQVTQQMVQYSMYQELHKTNEKQQLEIDRLKEINEELLEALKQKSQMIGDLQDRFMKRQKNSEGSIKDSFKSLF